jgi:large subunit ribosomal protein L2
MNKGIGNLINYKPITPSLRHTILVNKKNLGKTKFIPLLKKYSYKSGRNSEGHITIRHRGGYTKRIYRLINYYYDTINVPGTVISIEYDPNRSAFINLIQYDNGYYSFKIATHLVKVQSTVITSHNHKKQALGSSSELKYIPEGSLIHSIELRPDRGGILARSAGTYGLILNKARQHIAIKLPSKEIKFLSPYCKATIGIVSNVHHKEEQLGKAGRSRRKGRRPSVRGVAMNPVDHPHGGGEGKKSKKKEILNYTGKQRRGRKTSRKYKHTYIVNKNNHIYL